VDTEGLIEVLKERIENGRLQLNRLISHVESEQRHTVRHGKDIDKLIEQMDRIERAIEKRDQNWKDWIAIVLSIGSLLYAIFGKWQI
jgi:hypothetical protein